MAQNMTKVAKMARNLAIAHIIVGFLLICFGIGHRLVEFHRRCRFTGAAYFGIWIGIWVSIICHLISELRLHDSLKTKVKKNGQLNVSTACTARKRVGTFAIGFFRYIKIQLGSEA